MSHHVTVTLPDGLAVRVDYREPIVPVLRAISEETHKPRERIDYGRLGRLDLEAAAWRDANPGRMCSLAEQTTGACDARHRADWPDG